MKLIVKKSYPVAFKSFIFTKKFALEARVSSYFKNIDNEYQKIIFEKLFLFNINVKKVLREKLITLRSFEHIEVCNLSFYEARNYNNENLYFIEISDFAIIKKYRGKGIGTQIMQILEEIALKNKVKYIIGELQQERKDEPLDGRINFFQKNGFSVWEEKKSRFSGWITKKEIKNL